jgi:hypothetical protein
MQQGIQGEGAKLQSKQWMTSAGPTSCGTLNSIGHPVVSSKCCCTHAAVGASRLCMHMLQFLLADAWGLGCLSHLDLLLTSSHSASMPVPLCAAQMLLCALSQFRMSLLPFLRTFGPHCWQLSPHRAGACVPVPRSYGSWPLAGEGWQTRGQTADGKQQVKHRCLQKGSGQLARGRVCNGTCHGLLLVKGIAVQRKLQKAAAAHCKPLYLCHSIPAAFATWDSAASTATQLSTIHITPPCSSSQATASPKPPRSYPASFKPQSRT